MKALLLAAGFGTRLRPLTDSIPKCLVPIDGRPLMDYWLEMFYFANIKPVVVNLHYLSDVVFDYLKESRFKKNIIPVYEKKLLGTGGTLLENKAVFENDRVLMAHGDNLSFFDMDAFIKAHIQRPEKCEITMMTFDSDIPEHCGIVELDQDNVVCAFHEKVVDPPGRLANGAVYILEPSVINFLKNLGKKTIDFSTEVLPEYVGKIYTFHNYHYHRDIGTIDSYKRAESEFSEFAKNRKSPN